MESSKYHFEIDHIDPNTIHGMILQQIEPGSFVLECGCASGYMTKFMHEQMECTVDAIDIDADCVGNAAKYARHVYCGDLEQNGWSDHFRIDGQYDYILFADVLEHLKDPLTALQKAVELLRDEGRIIVSIPNICHNDIIVRMFYDHWNYSNLGLLDNTHVHFWGGLDLPGFFDKAGLKISILNGIKIRTQQTEQKYPDEVDERLLNLLKERELGEVYQYVIVCEKK